MTNQNDTLNWYQENAKEFIERTATVDMQDLYCEFLRHLPSGSHIMDLGCGAGNAALFFIQMGYSVLAIDGCQELCEYTHKRVGCPVRCQRFEKLDDEDAFDGVWACASLLHVRKSRTVESVAPNPSRAENRRCFLRVFQIWGDGKRLERQSLFGFHRNVAPRFAERGERFS